MKHNPVPNYFDSIQTNHMTIRRVKIAYLGLFSNSNLYLKAHDDFVCVSLVKYFGIFNDMKSLITSRIARQLYFAFIIPHFSYGIEVYGHCSDEYLSKLQILQNKLSKLTLKLDGHTSTNQLQHNLSLLKETFCNYHEVRQTQINHRNNYHIDLSWSRTDMCLRSCNSWAIKGARLGNENFRQSFPIFINNVSKHG